MIQAHQIVGTARMIPEPSGKEQVEYPSTIVELTDRQRLLLPFAILARFSIQRLSGVSSRLHRLAMKNLM